MAKNDQDDKSGQLPAATASSLMDQLSQLREHMLKLESAYAAQLEGIDELQLLSARNLLHYVAMRHHDLRGLQEELVHWGLSSLGRCEAHVMANVNAVLRILAKLSDSKSAVAKIEAPVDYLTGRETIERCTQDLFGPKPLHRGAHIMVTMPATAADDYQLVRDLLADGMNCMRINCAHDSAEQWSAMISNLRRAEAELEVSCRVFMDLGGPKLRTGPIAEGPRILKWRPHRNSFGKVMAPSRIWLSPSDAYHAPPFPADAAIPVDRSLLDVAQPGDTFQFKDAGGRPRRLRIVGCEQDGLWAESNKTTYVAPNLLLRLSRKATGDSKAIAANGRVGSIAAVEQSIVLYKGDRLIVSDNQQPGMPARHDQQGRVIEPARVSCTLPAVMADVRVGDRILLDDGKIGGVVREVCPHYLIAEITQARPNGERLRGDKGINLPDTELRLDALTEKDIEDLEFIVANADIVGYSFVRRAEDVHKLQSELARRGRPDMGIVLKIENRQAFEHLPSLLLAAMRSPVAGVMIARGDLAVECGWQRLAELQEEILWMCEAAHMPVVWATQVLERLAKEGMPSRAEITDAAMSVRAECVMLNKGPHVVEAVRVLDDILLRMQDHQVKKRPMLRRLRLAENLSP